MWFGIQVHNRSYFPSDMKTSRRGICTDGRRFNTYFDKFIIVSSTLGGEVEGNQNGLIVE